MRLQAFSSATMSTHFSNGIRRKILTQRYEEYLIPGFAVISLLISCIIISSKKFLWNDELLSFYLLDDRSLSHMLVAWSDKFNQAPPLYFSLGWLWDKVFGSTELSLRLFSSVSLSIACIVVWTVLRRTYDFWSTTIGTLSVFCLSEHVLYHNAEVRMYGLFTTVCAFGLLQFDSINRRQKCSSAFLSINSLIHCTIVLTHLYGVFYSAAILASFIVRDKYFGIFRQRVYLSVLIGWTILIPLSPLIINQSNNSAKWYSTFSLPETINMLIPFSKFSWFILILLVISILLYLIEPSSDDKPEIIQTNASRQIPEIAVLIFAAFFMLVPCAAWIITVTLRPLLNDRYIIPTITLSWSILLTLLTSRMIPDFQGFRRIAKATSKNRVHSFNLRATILSAFALGLLVHPISYAMKFSAYSQKPGANDANYGYIDLPIAMEAGHDFLPRFYYAEKPSRYFHILDWDTAIKNAESRFATGDYVHLEALSRNYPFIQSIQSTAFLRRYGRFLVLNEEDQKWFEARIKNNPEYKIRQLGRERGANGILEVFLVEYQNQN